MYHILLPGCSCNGALRGGHGECRDKYDGKPWCFINQEAKCSDSQQFKSFFTSFQACSGMYNEI